MKKPPLTPPAPCVPGKTPGFFFLLGAIALALLLFFAAACPVTANKGFLPEGGVILHEKEMRWESAGRDMTFPSSILIPATYFARENSLVVRHAGFRIRGQEGILYLPFSSLMESPDGKKHLLSGEGRSKLFSFGILSGLFLLVFGFLQYGRKKKEGSLTEKEESLFHCFFILIFHYLFFALFRFQEPDTYVMDSDSNGYFQVISQILKGDFQSKGVYPAGLGILYLPFIFLLGAEKAADLTPVLPAFSSLFVLPGSFLLLYLTFRKFAGRKATLAGILFWIVFSGIFFITESPSHGGLFSPLGYFHYLLGGGNAYIYKVYRLAVLGFSSLTEPFACFFTALLLFLSLYWKGGWKKGLLTGGLFGFACMVRLNILFFAPAIFFCFFMAEKSFFRFRKKEEIFFTLSTSFAALAGFLCIFSFQLFLNYCYFRDPFIFPYSLHYAELYKGFQIGNIARSSAFYFQCFAPILGLFAAGILMGKGTFHSKLFLTLSAIPTLLFFCGLCELGQNYRFLMPIYGIVCIGIFLPDFFRKKPLGENLLFLLILFLLLIPVYPVRLFLPLPEMIKEFPPSQWYLPELLYFLRSWYFLPLLLLVLFSAYRKKNFFLGGYFLIFAAFLFFPQGVWCFLLFAGVLIFFTAGWIFREFPFFRKKSV